MALEAQTAAAESDPQTGIGARAAEREIEIYQAEHTLRESSGVRGLMDCAEIPALQGCAAWGDIVEETMRDLWGNARIIIELMPLELVLGATQEELLDDYPWNPKTSQPASPTPTPSLPATSYSLCRTSRDKVPCGPLRRAHSYTEQEPRRDALQRMDKSRDSSSDSFGGTQCPTTRNC